MSGFASAFAHLRESPHYQTATTTGAAASTSPFSSSIVLTARRQQQHNIVAQLIRNVPVEYTDNLQPADFATGNIGILFLSVKYHLLHPAYLFTRLREVSGKYQLQVVLVLVDVEAPNSALHDISVMCVRRGFTLVVSWSPEEAARYLETYKTYERKPADMLKGERHEDYLSQLTAFLTSVKGISKSDVVTLLATFGSVAHVMEASIEEISLCHGFGEKKARKLFDAFHDPFTAKSGVSQE